MWKSSSNANYLANKFTEDSDINLLAINLGNIKIQSINKDFSGYSFSGFTIEIDRKISLDINQWTILNKIANICLN